MLTIGLAAIDIGPCSTVDDDVRRRRCKSIFDGRLVADVQRCTIEAYDTFTFSREV